MAIRLIIYLVLFVFLISCQDDDDIEIKNPDQTNNSLESPIYIYSDSLHILSFSGYNWKTVDSKQNYDLSHFCDSDPNNAYTDHSNILHLRVSKQDSGWKGIILELDTVLSSGVYSFEIISNIKELNKYAELTFSLLNVDNNKAEKISELGIKFSYLDNDSAVSPLQYFIYTTTDKVPFEFVHEEPFPDITLTKHLIEIDEGFIRLASFEGFLDYQSSEFFEYIFEFSENDLELEIPSEIKIRISLCFEPEFIEEDFSDFSVDIKSISFTKSEMYYSRF